MQTAWDYTRLASAYVKRPDYADDAIDALVRRADVPVGAPACDVGAGVGHLTLGLLDRGLEVTAVEPNEAMRQLGRERTAGRKHVRWSKGTGEWTGQASEAFALVTFGSSFNVTDRPRALVESARILKPGGWFACMWNHRDLDDPLQREIEETIASRVEDYRYGTRRQDQTAVIAQSELFEAAEKIEGRVVHRVRIADFVEAWRSHATLQRQAGDEFPAVVAAIEALLLETGRPHIDVPYTTRVWLAQLRRDTRP